MTPKPRVFVLVDFGASLIHTHHKQSLFAFANFVRKFGFGHEVWLPFGSQIKSNEYNLKRKLLPGSHSVNFSFSKLETWVPSLFGKIFFAGERYDLRFLQKLHLEIVTKFFCFLIKGKYRKDPIEIIFTTACPYSLKSISTLEQKKVNMKIYCRFTNTAENRFRILDTSGVDNFLRSAKLFKYVQPRFGVETEAHYKKIANPNYSKIYITKFPWESQSQPNVVVSDKIMVSFLGYPSTNKGSDLIPEIVNLVQKNRPDIQFQIQISENFNHKKYYSNDDSKIKFLRGKLDDHDMNIALKKSAVICLPYSISAFAINASAMMYHALDFSIPIITFRGSAFAKEVDDFGCGVTVSDVAQMSAIISHLTLAQISKWQNGCNDYNQFRNFSNSYFLNISSDLILNNFNKSY
jgi:glycosyltransferase involved in cell wall biosynthesis